MRDIFGITGTPGTGKKSVAPIIAKSLGVPCLGLNDIAKSAGLVRARAEVDPGLLKKALAKLPGRSAVVFGHLLPYSADRTMVARVAVLRCEPLVLRRRLESRGYAKAKVLENLRAELIGLISADASLAFGRAKTFEVDTTQSTPAETAKKILSAARGPGKRPPPVDWMPNYDSGPKLRSLLPSD
ncbi:MAG: AAA family ATPase [Thaumarchaeota archaeon]|nr:AAA family ATPase [Nitrososphaerota archaeon]